MRARVRQLEASLTDIRDLLTLRSAELDRLRGSSEMATTGSAPAGGVPSLSSGGLQTTAAEGQSAVGGAMEGLAGASASAESAEATQMPLTTPVVTDARGEENTATRPQGEPSAGPGGEAALVTDVRKVPGGVRTEPEPTSEGPGQPAKPAAPEPQTETIASGLADLSLIGGTLAYVPIPVLWVGMVAAPMLGLLAWLAVRRRRRIDASLSELDLSGAQTLHGEGTSPMPPLSESQNTHMEEAVAKRGPPDAGSGFANLPGSDDEADSAAEADIYIAYGRYQDAQGLLKQAIARSPHSAVLHYKLAETYGSAEDYGALASLLNEMQAQGMDQAHPEQWTRLVELARVGRDLASCRPLRPICARRMGPRSPGSGKQCRSSAVMLARAIGCKAPGISRTTLTLDSPAPWVRAKAPHWTPVTTCSMIDSMPRTWNLTSRGSTSARFRPQVRPMCSGSLLRRGCVAATRTWN